MREGEASRDPGLDRDPGRGRDRDEPSRQTLPAIVVGLYTRWLHRWALVVGWAVGMALGTVIAVSQDYEPVYPVTLFGTEVNIHTALIALAANFVVTVGGTLLLRAVGTRDELDETRPEDFDELAEDVDVHRRPPEPAVEPA